MATITGAEGLRLGLKVWVGVGGPVFSLALVALGWNFLDLKLQAAPEPDAQSTVVRRFVPPPAGRLSPPWERNAAPDYPVDLTPQTVSVFSYNAPYKESPDLREGIQASYADSLFLERQPAPAPRGRHRQQ